MHSSVNKKWIRNAVGCLLGLCLFCLHCNRTTSPSVSDPDLSSSETKQIKSVVPELSNKNKTTSEHSKPLITPPENNTDLEDNITLAKTPVMDLISNRFMWHLYQDSEGTGLVIPFLNEGFPKYTQEYKNPWGEVIEFEGTLGRRLSKKTAKLRFPWSYSGAATLYFRIHGVKKGQKISLSLNGSRIANATLKAEWQDLVIKIDEGIIRTGENELIVYLSKKGRSYALFHSLQVFRGELTVVSDKTMGNPVGPRTLEEVERTVLGGYNRLTLYTEVAESSWLEFYTGLSSGNARFKVEVRTADKEAESKQIFEHKAKAGLWELHRVSLASYKNHLIELSLSIDGDNSEHAFWGSPRIALEEIPEPATLLDYPVKNTILIVVDALRADRLALYGDTRIQTPHISEDGFAQGVVFMYNQSASPSSPPSHSSIQTGMIPRVHGVAGDKGQLHKGIPMLSTQLGDAGIKTAYYGNNSFGMTRLKTPGKWTEFHQPNREGKGGDCRELTEELLGFVERQVSEGNRFFISALPMEPHTPYRYHEGISEHYYSGSWKKPVGRSVDGILLGKLSGDRLTLNPEQWQQLFALYDGEIEYYDGCYGDLLKGLDRLKIRDDTLIVITSDHGEGMFEHGRMGHAFGHQSELSNVPLIFIHKKFTHQKIHVVSGALDITPTILELMGVKRSEQIQGGSLVSIMARGGPWIPRVVSMEYGRSYALRSVRWKYSVDYHGSESLFDLNTDPTEQKPLGENNPIALRYMRDMTGFFLAYRKNWKIATWGTLNNHRAGFGDFIE